MRIPGWPMAWMAPLLVLVAASYGAGDGQARAADRAASELDGPRGAALEADRRPDGFQELPEGVTGEMVAEGEDLYGGAGFCYTCHGADGRGVPQLGADLTDDDWTHTDGTYEAIVQRVRSGVSAEASTVGVPMPPRGGGRLSDEQVRAVAAYVWVLSRGGT